MIEKSNTYFDCDHSRDRKINEIIDAVNVGNERQDIMSTANEKEFQMLESYGVPRERAKTVSNGIVVLATRYEKEIAALKAEIANTSTNTGMLVSPKLPTLAECQAHVQRELWGSHAIASSVTTTELVYDFISRQLQHT